MQGAAKKSCGYAIHREAVAEQRRAMELRCVEKQGQELQWIRGAMIRNGIAEHCTATIRKGNASRGNERAKKGADEHRKELAKNGVAVARNSFARQMRSIEPKGQATQRLGQASQRTASDMQSKDLIGKGDEWPGQAEEQQ